MAACRRDNPKADLSAMIQLPVARIPLVNHGLSCQVCWERFPGQKIRDSQGFCCEVMVFNDSGTPSGQSGPSGPPALRSIVSPKP